MDPFAVAAKTWGGISAAYMSLVKGPRVQREARALLPHIAGKLERRLGIRAESDPLIKASLPPALTPSEEYLDMLLIGGQYVPETRTIHVNPSAVHTPAPGLLERISMVHYAEERLALAAVLSKDPSLLFCHKLDPGQMALPLSEIVAHEYGHHYNAVVLKRRGMGICDFRRTPLGMAIDEGIAAYCAQEVQDRHPHIELAHTFKADGSMGSVYRVGYAFVKPVLDEFRANGIIHLLCNPPADGSSRASVLACQARVLRECAELYPASKPV